MRLGFRPGLLVQGRTHDVGTEDLFSHSSKRNTGQSRPHSAKIPCLGRKVENISHYLRPSLRFPFNSASCSWFSAVQCRWRSGQQRQHGRTPKYGSLIPDHRSLEDYQKNFLEPNPWPSQELSIRQCPPIEFFQIFPLTSGLFSDTLGIC